MKLRALCYFCREQLDDSAPLVEDRVRGVAAHRRCAAASGERVVEVGRSDGVTRPGPVCCAYHGHGGASGEACRSWP